MDPWSSSLSGRGPPQPLPPPGMGPRTPGAAEQFTGFLRGLGMPQHTSQQLGALAPWTPPGAAFEGGQAIGQGWQEGDLGRGLGGALQVGMAALPLRLPGPMPRIGNGLDFAHGDVAAFLRDAGARNVRSREARTGGSHYVDFGSNTSPQTVRISADGHVQPPGAADAARLIDTARAPHNDWAALQSEMLRRVLETTPKRQRPDVLAGARSSRATIGSR